jgi:hypothetical protein
MVDGRLGGLDTWIHSTVQVFLFFMGVEHSRRWIDAVRNVLVCPRLSRAKVRERRLVAADEAASSGSPRGRCLPPGLATVPARPGVVALADQSNELVALSAGGVSTAIRMTQAGVGGRPGGARQPETLSLGGYDSEAS